MHDYQEMLMESCNNLSLNTNQVQIKKLIEYMDFILEWNYKINLTAIKDKSDFIDKHIIDSLLISTLDVYENSKTIMDVGTGAGFPGVPLAIYSSNKKFYLVDSLLKRTKVVEEGCNFLDLKNVIVCHVRGEVASKELEIEKGVDLVLSRAVASLEKLIAFTMPNVKKGGSMIALKGPKAEEEIEQAGYIMKRYNCYVDSVVDLPHSDMNHKAIIIKSR